MNGRDQILKLIVIWGNLNESRLRGAGNQKSSKESIWEIYNILCYRFRLEICAHMCRASMNLKPGDSYIYCSVEVWKEKQAARFKRSQETMQVENPPRSSLNNELVVVPKPF